jgi:hypothetical protein
VAHIVADNVIPFNQGMMSDFLDNKNPSPVAEERFWWGCEDCRERVYAGAHQKSTPASLLG